MTPLPRTFITAWPWLVTGIALAVAAPCPAARGAEAPALRIATFNVQQLSRDKLDDVDALGRGKHPQLTAAATVIQHVRPDVLVLNEIDFDAGGRRNARLFVERYLAVPQAEDDAIDFPYVLFLPTNTGVPSGFDLSGDGRADGPEDAWGFGHYPGQYGMALISRVPIDPSRARTFRLFRWQAMPGNLMPDGTGGKPAWYAPAAAAAIRLSSKSHWDVLVRLGGRSLHLLISHPTPPVFDGDEDRNGRRNFDEVRLIADYLSGGERAAYLVDDRGRRGGLSADASFVILGDLNADPDLGERFGPTNAIGQLLAHPRIQDPRPRSPGAERAARAYAGDRATRTADFGRADYVLPSSDLDVVGSGVVWPAPGDPLHQAAEAASDHHLVWVDLAWPQP